MLETQEVSAYPRWLRSRHDTVQVLGYLFLLTSPSPSPIIGNSNAHLGHFVFKTLSSWVHVWSCSPLLHSHVLMMSSVPSNPPCYHIVTGRACNNEGMASPCSLRLSAFPTQGNHHLDSHSGQFWLSFIYTLYPPFILSKCSPASLTCCKSPAYGGTFLMHTANERWPFHQF